MFNRESMLFLNILEMTPIFFVALREQFKAPSCSCFWQILHFLEFSRLKRAINGQTCRNLHTVPKIVKPVMHAYYEHAHLFAKLEVISRISKNIPCSKDGVRVGQKASSMSTLFLNILGMAPIFPMALYDQFKAPYQVVLFYKFCIFGVFSFKKGR